MMDESDEDFKELCASFFQRVKKNAAREVSGERKTQKACSSTQKRSKLKNPSQAATKSKTLQNSSEKKPPSGSHIPRTKKQATTKSRKGEPAVSVNEEGGALIPAPDQPVLCGRAPSIQTESAPNGNSQPPPPCFTVTAVPSPSKPRASKLVVQRMQRFKRADPERLRHASEESSLKTALEENCPRSPQEEMVLGNGSKPKLPTIDSDAAVALALQQEFGQDGASARDDSLEEKGLFFCQICQKNLSAMNVTRREQHVNRCLDESEKALRPAIPQIPDCPICGKPFLTAKSRISHLKQCAVKMEVGPQLLLQAVRLQTAQPREDSSPQAPSFSNHVGGLKRKGATNKKEPQKRRKVNRPEAPSEDVLVAMALSRSEMEQCPAVPTLSWESAFSGKIKLKAEKKPRKKKPLVCPPQLLVQDSETTGRQLEDLVAQLLSEEMELSSTPPLPASRISKEKSGEASWHLQLPKGKRNFLWEGSALTGAWAKESFYTAGLVPLVVSQWPPKEPELPLALPKQPEPPALHSSPPVGQIPRNQLLSSSQREHQALQDLVDLAEEGLSASSWPGSLHVPTGLDLVPSSPPLTGFILPSTEKPLERGGHDLLSLKLLVADFGAMVNNPHLSDIQFQTDGGEVFYAHKFVLYARCPLLIQYVNTDGFSAAEDGDLTHRILLHDVSSEAAHAFLNYLYMADTDLPPSLAPDLRSLALRFGVHDLLHLCEQVPVRTDLEGELQEEEEDENCKNRAENFQELLRSMWVDEEEEAETLLKSDVCEEDREKVNEAEMEEIYEFAATQRKQLQAERAASVGEDACQLEGVSPVARPALAGVQGNSQLEKAEQMESSKLGKVETPTSWGNARHSFLLLQGQCSDGIGEVETKKQEAPREAAGHPSSCSPSGSPEARCKKGSLLPPVKTHDYKQPFASTQREFSELSQITVDHKQLSDPVRERQVEMSHPSSPEQAPPSSPRCLLSQSPTGGSPSQSCLHLYPTSDLSPSVSQSHSGISKVTSPRSPAPLTPAKQRRNSSVLTLLREPGHQKGKRVSSMSEHKNRGILISPAKSPPIDLTQSVPDHMSPKTQDPPCHVKKEDEIILLLDSDEELELEHTKTKLVSNDSSEERKVLEVSPRSPELFSVIDIDEDQEHFQSSPKREAELQKEEAERQQEGQAALGGRELPWLFCQQNSTDEDSSRDASWLVPATPLSSRSRDCSAQTQITSLKTRTPADETAQVTARASLEHRTVQDTAQKFSVIMPQALAITPGTSDSCRQGFITPGTLDSSRQAYGSPAHFYPGCHKLSSPQPSCPLPDLARRIKKLSLPGPCLPNQAGADEVVEVGDSDDEQETACHQGNSSSLPNGDPPIPMADCCWHVEPLSPIPIDHLNLERTGPLSTSSPSSQAQEALHDSDSRSPGLLGTTPIRGSCAAQRDSQEQSLWAGSPGNSKLSFLNPALWDDWDEDDQNSPEAAPAVQTPSARAQNREEPETPKGANKKKNLPPKVPITPMPRYSIMETPVLKKELDRFGVRALPKRQMVLKLKEIFQYTHQTLESDSEDEIQSSQVSPGVPCSQAPATRTNKHSRSRGYTQLQTTAGLGTQRSKGPTKTKDPQHQKKQLSESIPHPSRSPAGELPPGPDDDAQLPASQEPMVISVDGSDSSFGSQSSSHEFGSALESAGEDEEGEEGVSASQAALTEETVRRYICSKPALYQKVLMYQPLELAELQAELKQDGIHVAMGKLLDILDAQCITFTTAAARKEKLKQKRRKNFGRKKKVRE